MISLGERAPDFTLPDTEGKHHSLDDGAGATAIVFTCNHRPYALAWHKRLMQVASEYGERGARFFFVSPNDAERYPADSYDAMKERVEKEGWPAPYLYDETQDVARDFDAKTTPDVFVLDSDLRLRYRGAPDADYREESENASWLREALDAVLEGREPNTAETEPVGCSVKWKDG